ncbi:MAG: phosphatase PAP2 family protein [Candidatus Krumholzibacteria bacterium]|nr:phosphatase PAP2 family protein [Candidatus Krumholzibacteria bacterium]MDH4335716.1 phosphatase PAP2 family protein [Candidatus Krumholzibacteria bacterium]MDH5270061.1 phosphatase PAP2 family protein [Candidatus Krumholzibacteria bacterium]
MLTALLAAAPCHADSPYSLNPKLEWTLLGTGALLDAVSVILVGQVEPFTVDELDRLDVNDINSFDRNGMHPYHDGSVGDVLVATTYLLPLTFLANDDMRRDWRTLGLMWVEANMINLGIDGVVKATVKRPRPYAYDPNAPLDKRTDSSARLSFYSGHTTGAALNCFFAARVFSDYISSKRARIAIWTGAAAIPAVVGYIRVDSGRHFRTDVITGYVVGAAIGYLVPELHRHPSDRLSLEPAAVLGDAGLALNVSF